MSKLFLIVLSFVALAGQTCIADDGGRAGDRPADKSLSVSDRPSEVRAGGAAGD